MNENSWLYWSSTVKKSGNSLRNCFHEWKFMALLKPPSRSLRPGTSARGFHEWKFMALLKLSLKFWDKQRQILVSMNENSWLYWSPVLPGQWVVIFCCFHEWKFMALLKLYLMASFLGAGDMFPWMKIHGSIEAWTLPRKLALPMPCFHEWKFMALLKLFLSSPVG